MNGYNKPVYSIFFHNYYGLHKSWMNFFSINTKLPAALYYNITEDSLENISLTSKDLTKELDCNNKLISPITIRFSSNKGKDIGGKMILLDAYLKLGLPTDYALFIHDKRSPHKVNNHAWADKLLSIGNSNFIEKSLAHFAANSTTGIIAAEGTLQNEWNEKTNNFGSNNREIIPGLLQLYNIHPDSFQYVAGTMFLCRMQPLKEFFERNNPLLIRQTLEAGNVTDENTGSYTHCWERLLSWVITSQHYTIKTF